MMFRDKCLHFENKDVLERQSSIRMHIQSNNILQESDAISLLSLQYFIVFIRLLSVHWWNTVVIFGPRPWKRALVWKGLKNFMLNGFQISLKRRGRETTDVTMAKQCLIASIFSFSTHCASKSTKSSSFGKCHRRGIIDSYFTDLTLVRTMSVCMLGDSYSDAVSTMKKI